MHIRRQDQAAVKAMRDVEMGNNPTTAQSGEKQSVVSVIERRFVTENKDGKDRDLVTRPEAGLKVARQDQRM